MSESNLQEHEGWLKNPFKVDGITERNITRNGKLFHTVNPETGEETLLQGLTRLETKLHDAKSYTKLFTDSRDILRGLTPSSIKLYMYIALNLKVNWDTVFLNPPDICQWCEFSKSTFYQAVEDLLKRKIIARRLGSYLEFWINPNIFYNGDRVKLFRYNKQNPNALSAGE